MPKRYGARRRASAFSRNRRRAAKPNRRGRIHSAHAHNRGHTARRSATRHARTDCRRDSHAAAYGNAYPGRRAHHAPSNKNAACKRIALRRHIYAHARKIRGRHPARKIAHADAYAHPYADTHAHFDAHAQIIGNAAAYA